MFHGLAYPTETPTVVSAETEAVYHQKVLLQVFCCPCLWPLKAPVYILGKVAKPLISPLTPGPLPWSCDHHWPSSHGARAFAIAGPTVWNSLPDSLRDPAVGPDQFRRDLKTHLFEWHCVSFSALAVFSRNALYKSTFYLLTYLLTQLPSTTAHDMQI